MEKDYGFVVVHVPHASVNIPETYRQSILLSDTQLRRLLCRMTDAFCDELYDAPAFPTRVVAGYSRVVCDMERFRDDRLEPRARKGQGLMYTRASFFRKLRENDFALREKILREIYDPHHQKLTDAVEQALTRYGKCLIIDGHSFNSRMIIKPDNLLGFADFDIGTDAYHTPDGLRDALCAQVKALGYTPKVNTPFGGAITPMRHYGKDKRVFAVMFETNRKLYMDEKNMTKAEGFTRTRQACHALMHCAADYVREVRV